MRRLCMCVCVCECGNQKEEGVKRSFYYYCELHLAVYATLPSDSK